MNFGHTKKVVAIALLFNILNVSSVLCFERIKVALLGGIKVTYSAVYNPYDAPPRDFMGHIASEFRDWNEFQQATEQPICMRTTAPDNTAKGKTCQHTLRPGIGKGNEVILPYNTNQLYLRENAIAAPFLKFDNLQAHAHNEKITDISVVVGGKGIEGIKINGGEIVKGVAQ